MLLSMFLNQGFVPLSKFLSQNGLVSVNGSKFKIYVSETTTVPNQNVFPFLGSEQRIKILAMIWNKIKKEQQQKITNKKHLSVVLN